MPCSQQAGAEYNEAPTAGPVQPMGHTNKKHLMSDVSVSLHAFDIARHKNINSGD